MHRDKNIRKHTPVAVGRTHEEEQSSNMLRRTVAPPWLTHHYVTQQTKQKKYPTPREDKRKGFSPVYRTHEPDRQEAHYVDVDAGLAVGDQVQQKNHNDAEDNVDEWHL